MRLCLALLLSPLAVVPPVFAEGVPEGLSLDYTCAEGAVLQAAYINTPAGESFAVVSFEGKLVPMKAGPTGSGVRYLSLDDTKLVWHTKGDAGFLAHDDADETMIAAECVAKAE